MTFRTFSTWLVPLATLAFFTACGGRSFQGGNAGSGSSSQTCPGPGCTSNAGSTSSGGSGNAGSANGSSGSSGCMVDGDAFDDGAADIAAPDGCNTCSCINGELACTAIGCVSTSCTYDGTFYEDGDSFPAIDGCNTCTCVEGAVSCTEIACVDPGECMSSLDCETDQFCQAPKGSCGGAGTCVNTDVGCTLQYAPVCGCDGVTYGNDCGAVSAGMNIAYDGECGVVAPTCGGGQCSDDQFCKYPAGYCSSSSRIAPPGGGAGAPVPVDPGTCTDLPMICDTAYAPVCGCDGVTYGNSCEADSVGMNVAYQGECPVSCFDNTGCAMDEYCMFEVGQCGGFYPPVAAFAPPEGDVAAPIVIAPTGTCQMNTGECTDQDAPVCGCDGVTYSNASCAAAAGMSVAYVGECGAVAPQ